MTTYRVTLTGGLVVDVESATGPLDAALAAPHVAAAYLAGWQLAPVSVATLIGHTTWIIVD